MKNNKLKKGLAYVGILILIISGYNYEHKYNPKYEILEENYDAFARYSKGKIYIGTKSYLIGCIDKIEDGDIIILDQRNSQNDPNMKIISSYKITDKDIRNEILEVLCKYEEKYPSKWNRTIESMRLEWFMHNISYKLNLEQDRTGDVDLDNNDEEYYDNEIIRRIFKL